MNSVQPLRAATINVGTLTCRSRELAAAFLDRRVDLACLQETKWKGTKAKHIGDGYTLFYYGVSSSKNGVGIVVSERFRINVTDVYRVSDRLMSVKITSSFMPIRIVTCYAPQTGADDIDKDIFWADFESHIRSIGEDEFLLIGGDLNGHVGATNAGYDRVHGGQGHGVRNCDGDRILECAGALDLALVNTYFKKRPSHLITYSSGGHDTQIDFWLLRRRDLRLVTNTKVMPQ